MSVSRHLTEIVRAVSDIKERSDRSDVAEKDIRAFLAWVSKTLIAERRYRSAAKHHAAVDALEALHTIVVEIEAIL